MNHLSALPFSLTRSDSVVGDEIVSTTERVHGLLRLDGERLFIQWRLSRATQHMGMQIRTDRELEPVREVEVPLSALAGAAVRWIWWRWPPGRYLVLTGADLRSFEEIAGQEGLRLDHPAELVLQIRHTDHLAAREFAGEVDLAIAERALRAAEESPRLGPGDTGQAQA
jgi:hypothetical protein